ncbi:Sodium/potassium/calcium exchanger-like protein [Dinothrombium tinctorium]|uniref:Sodium/potassium/calcium exchanger-like protein n=1 Tax=Dinothrombium tinctorium TaxID=1965070 RepID=A0A3S3P9A9_9ACAR|nr:Sodium/potassium/calcium exchanger-like protein [Dinothrombium tinctorium]
MLFSEDNERGEDNKRDEDNQNRGKQESANSSIGAESESKNETRITENEEKTNKSESIDEESGGRSEGNETALEKNKQKNDEIKPNETKNGKSVNKEINEKAKGKEAVKEGRIAMKVGANKTEHKPIRANQIEKTSPETPKTSQRPTEASPKIKRPKRCTPPAYKEFPPDIFGQTLRSHGFIIVHIAVACYMFYCLAIVCDHYFLPSLEECAQRLNLSEDVAGATFMAAGSSAPELFTAILGVFVAKGDVGIGTIVGSAVFNILFVIGLCGVLTGIFYAISKKRFFSSVTPVIHCGKFLLALYSFCRS